MVWKGLPIVIFGSGGISKEVVHIIEQINDYNKVPVFQILGFIENMDSKIGKVIINGYKIITSDNKFYEFIQSYKVLGAIIPQGNPVIKKNIYNKVKDISNLVFPNIIHPNVTFDKNSIYIGIGNILTSGVRLTNNIKLKNFNLINLNATIGHDTQIGNFNVINPLVAISGEVEIHDCCLIGTGANILQKLKIQDNVIVGAGAVVTKNIETGELVVGVPAKKYKK